MIEYEFKRKRYDWFTDEQGRAAKIRATMSTPQAKEAARAEFARRKLRTCIKCGFATQAYHVLVEIRTIGRPIQYACRGAQACNKRRVNRGRSQSVAA